MTKQNIFPYHAHALEMGMQGVEVLDIGGAAIMHFDNVAAEHSQELKYPCRIDAMIMVVCVRGEVSFSSHMSDYTLKANQLFLSSASVFQFRALEGSEFYMVAVNPEFLTTMNFDVRLAARFVLELRVHVHVVNLEDRKMTAINRFFGTILLEHSSNEMSEYMENSLRHGFCALVYRICDSVLGKEDVPQPIGVKERSSEYFERLMNLLSDHYREQRNVEFYAEKMNISSKHLSRVIRNYTGKSVHQWIDEFVALEIKNLLKYSNMSIQQISYSLHFPNPSFMGQYFKRITGMTPGEYKRS